MAEMSDTKDMLKEEVRSFFKNLSWKKVLTFLFFVLLASIFWMMQIWRQKFDATYVIPIKYVNVPENIAFESDLPENIEVRIRDDGSTLINYYLTKRKDSLEINIKDALKEDKEKMIQGANLKKLIQDKFSSSTELLGYNPSYINYKYSALHEKKLPVIYDGYVRLASGYLLDGELTISPDSVMAYGTKAALDTLRYAHTVDDSLNNITSARKVRIAMQPKKGIKYFPGSIELNIPVDEFTQKDVEVPVTCINLPENLNIKLFPSSVKIPFFVGLRRYDDIDATDFKVIVNYNDIITSKETYLPVIIAEIPDYVQPKLPIPTEVEFVLEQK
ncbi:MAG: YbbR-like domain-containing protein [Prevotella sp.]|jgi:hypothetical protein|nr:YbbR-like domain-containing protein [Prevotella sp.]